MWIQLLIFGVVGCSGSVVYRDNAYEDLLVAISPDVPQGSEENGQNIIDNIKKYLISGSSSLYTASRGWVYIKSVNILLPTTWTLQADPVDQYVFEDAEIRVDKENPLYGNSPFTLQTGGCGEGGQYSQVPQTFLQDLTASTLSFGPPGHVFVHEWSKLRYGVFEEFGYPGDSKYPMFYYKTVWTQNGQQNVITPNFCTNTDLTGNMIDMDTGRECYYDEKTGLPDRKCFFQPQNETAATSSLMALQYLQKVEQFCDDGEEFYHDSDLPTKQNDLCNERSVWNVIKDHGDFAGFGEIAPRNDTVPVFRILKPREASFVMVLDVSGSMGQHFPRLDRLKQAVKRFINYDLKNGTKLGVVTFSKEATEIYPMTPITEQNKQEVFGKIDKLNADGGTCMHLGLRMGLKVLKDGGILSGGVMIFLTDGVAACNGDCTNCPGCASDETGDGVTCVIQEIADQGVRVITIAFGPKAGENIEEMAKRTNGKAFFVPDNTGPEDINNALDGSLTYQPEGPIADAEIQLLQKTFNNTRDFNVEFPIDKTIGKEVKVQVDTTVTGDKFDVFTLVHPNGTEEEESVVIDVGVFQKIYPTLEVGMFNLRIHSTENVDFLSIRITSKPSEDTLPIYTKCWTSIGNGDEAPTAGMKLAVLAQVLQGGNPVIGAKVVAYIERDGQDAPIEIQLFDQGSSPDQIQNDGIYSRYFTRFDEEGRYTLKCQVEGTDGTNINQGFIDARNSKVLPSKPSSANPICCGSDTVNEDSKLDPTGNFSRSSVGGSFSVPSNAINFNYPPGTVTDLAIGQIDFLQQTFKIEFTAPGADLDNGIATSYQIRYSLNKTLLTSPQEYDIIKVSDFADGEQESALDPVKANTKVSVNINMTHFELYQPYYFMLVVSDGEKFSQSNTARVTFVHVEPNQHVDVIPPTTVTDLAVILNIDTNTTEDIDSMANTTFSVTFTAPGDERETDGTYVKASSYLLKHSSLTDQALLEDGLIITEDQLLSGSLEPQDYNSIVTLEVKIENFTMPYNDKHFFQLTVMDNVGLSSQSNIVYVTPDVEPPTAVSDLLVIMNVDTENTEDMDSMANTTFSVTFTAPGDYNPGNGTQLYVKASSYVLQYSNSTSEHSLEHGVLITDDQIISGSLKPQDYNSNVTLEVKIENFTMAHTEKYFFQFTSVDNVGLSSQSNIVEISFQDDSGLSWGEWTGIGVGIAVLMCLVVAAMAFLIRRTNSSPFGKTRSYQVSQK